MASILCCAPPLMGPTPNLLSASSCANFTRRRNIFRALCITDASTATAAGAGATTSSATSSPRKRAATRFNSFTSRAPTKRIMAAGSTLAFNSNLCMAPQCGPALAASAPSMAATLAVISFNNGCASGGIGFSNISRRFGARGACSIYRICVRHINPRKCVSFLTKLCDSVQPQVCRPIARGQLCG